MVQPWRGAADGVHKQRIEHIEEEMAAMKTRMADMAAELRKLRGKGQSRAR